MAVVCEILQNSLARDRGDHRRQSPLECRACEAGACACASAIGSRSSLEGVVAEFEVLGIPQRRGPAAEARTHYLETPASAARRAQLREQQRLAQLSRPRPDTRPDKRDRRRLMRLHRDQM